MSFPFEYKSSQGTFCFSQSFEIDAQCLGSLASLQCLVNVDHSPNFSSYVEGVNIGPERIHSGLRTFLSSASGSQTDHFEQEGAAAWQILVREQKDFDATRKTSTMLEDAFFAFENLKHIHIDSYPDKKDDAARRKACGCEIYPSAARWHFFGRSLLILGRGQWHQ
jgi:hypothetical protein